MGTGYLQRVNVSQTDCDAYVNKNKANSLQVKGVVVIEKGKKEFLDGREISYSSLATPSARCCKPSSITSKVPV
jgi:hypothetical protein